MHWRSAPSSLQMPFPISVSRRHITPQFLGPLWKAKLEKVEKSRHRFQACAITSRPVGCDSRSLAAVQDCIHTSSEPASVVVYVADICSSCNATQASVDFAVFSSIADVNAGSTAVRFRQVRCGCAAFAGSPAHCLQSHEMSVWPEVLLSQAALQALNVRIVALNDSMPPGCKHVWEHLLAYLPELKPYAGQLPPQEEHPGESGPV